MKRSSKLKIPSDWVNYSGNTYFVPVPGSSRAPQSSTGKQGSSSLSKVSGGKSGNSKAAASAY